MLYLFSSHREKKIESLPSGGEANASTTFSLKTAEKAGKVTQSKVAEDKEKSVKDKPVEKTEKIRTELRPSPRIEAPSSVAARNSHPDSPPRPKISSKVVVLNKAKDDKQRYAFEGIVFGRHFFKDFLIINYFIIKYVMYHRGAYDGGKTQEKF